MKTPHKSFFIFIFILALCGCAQWDIPSQDLEITADQSELVVDGEGIMVPQTLGPSQRSEGEMKPKPAIMDTARETDPPGTQTPLLQLTTESQTTSAGSQSPAHAENVFGEFAGVSSQWEESKKQLTIQLKEQSQKLNELKVKLQLINQVTKLVNFVTKATVNEQNDFLMAFTIENRAPFAIKDISITCDQIAPTGAVIRSQTETIYNLIQSSTRSTFTPIPYGNRHRQTKSLQCQITNFTVENASPDVRTE